MCVELVVRSILNEYSGMGDTVRRDRLFRKIRSLVLNVLESLCIDHLEPSFTAEWCDKVLSFQRSNAALIQELVRSLVLVEPFLYPLLSFFRVHTELFSNAAGCAAIHDPEVHALGPHILFLNGTFSDALGGELFAEVVPLVVGVGAWVA